MNKILPKIEPAAITATTTCCDKITIEHNRTDWTNGYGNYNVGGSREKELVLSKYTQNGREYYYHCPGDDEACSAGDVALWVDPNGYWSIGPYKSL